MFYNVVSVRFLCASCHVNGVAMLCLKATEDFRVLVIAHSIAEGLQIELLRLYIFGFLAFPTHTDW